MTEEQFIKEAEKRFDREFAVLDIELKKTYICDFDKQETIDLYEPIKRFIRKLQKEAVEFGRASKGEEFTQAEKNQLISYVEGRDQGEYTGWYYGNKEHFNKRHESILKKLKSKDTSK